MKKNINRNNLWATLILLMIPVLLAFGIVTENIKDQVVWEAGSLPQASEYLVRDLKIPAKFQTELSSIDPAQPGTYDLVIDYNGREYPVELVIRDTLAPTAQLQSLEVFATQRPEAGDFVLAVEDATQVEFCYHQEPDMAKEGVQTVSLAFTDLGGNTAIVETELTVIHDITGPQIAGAQDIRYFIGTMLDPLADVSVSDDLDPQPQLWFEGDQVDYATPGTYPLTYLAQDICGNVTTVTVNVEVILDNQAPTIMGVNPRVLFQGSTIAYRSGVVVMDDLDPTVSLKVDSSKVDLSTPGVYPLVYSATDAAGHTTIQETTVTVYEKQDDYVEEAVIYARIDEIIAEIITEDMTVKEQIEAIYKWARYGFWYSGYSEKMDWKQAGYEMITTGYGDCFSFYGATKLMFERLRIPNIDVTRISNPYRTTSHYWSMVSIDGGETYYYFDSTPFAGVSYTFILATDADLDFFDSYICRGYFARDRSKLPATPTTKP